MKICQKCNELYDDKYNFCQKCGEGLSVYHAINAETTQSITDVSNLNNYKDPESNKKLLIVGITIVLIAIGAFFIINQGKENKQIVNTNIPANSPTTNENSVKPHKNVREELKKETKAAITAEKQAEAVKAAEAEAERAAREAKEKQSQEIMINAPGYILVDDVFVRDAPNFNNSNIIGEARKASRFQIIAYIGDWAKIEDRSKTIGYILRKHISTDGTNVDWSTGDKYGKEVHTAVVKATDVNMRASNSLNSKVVGRFIPGERVAVLGFYKEWVRVKRTNGQVGYIWRTYLDY